MALFLCRKGREKMFTITPVFVTELLIYVYIGALMIFSILFLISLTGFIAGCILKSSHLMKKSTIYMVASFIATVTTIVLPLIIYRN